MPKQIQSIKVFNKTEKTINQFTGNKQY